MQFVSKYSALRLVMQGGETYVERGRTITKEGKYITFLNNSYSTTDAKEIAWLKKHPDFGVDFWVVKEDEVDRLAKVKRELEK